MVNFLYLLLYFSVFSSPLVSDEYHNLVKRQIECINQIKQLSKQFEEQYKTRYLQNFLNNDVNRPDYSFNLDLMIQKKMTIDEARPLIVSMIRQFWQLMKTNPNFVSVRNYLVSPPKQLTPNNIAIKLSFWDENMDRYHAPYVALIHAKYSEIAYYFTNPEDQFLQEKPQKESFEEAFQRSGVSLN